MNVGETIVEIATNVTINNLYTNYIIDTPVAIMGQYPWWYNAYLLNYFGPLSPNEVSMHIPSSQMMMRLTLNVNEMYKHKVEASNLCKLITNAKGMAVKCIHSPILMEVEGGQTYARQYIDIYPLFSGIDVSKLNITATGKTIEETSSYIETMYLNCIRLVKKVKSP